MSKVEPGSNVSVHYVGTFDDGTVFDSSRDRGEPLGFVASAGQMIKGFDQAVLGMTTGETKTFRLAPEDAYGNHNEELVQKISTKLFPPDFDFVEGATVRGDGPNGQPLLAKIVSHTPQDEVVLLDFNHPMAGSHLNFEVEVVSVQNAQAVEGDSSDSPE